MKLSDFHDGFEGWTPVQVNPTGNVQPQIANDQTQRSGYLRTTLPLPLQYSGDTVKQFNTPGMSMFRIAPLPPGGNPAVNSAASSSAQASAAAAIGNLTPNQIPPIDLSIYNVNGGVENSLTYAHIQKAPKTVTANYTTTIFDYYIEVDSLTPVTITLTEFAMVLGQAFLIKNISTGVVTIVATTGLIENQASVELPLINQVLEFVWDGTNFSLN